MMRAFVMWSPAFSGWGKGRSEGTIERGGRGAVR